MSKSEEQAVIEATRSRRMINVAVISEDGKFIASFPLPAIPSEGDRISLERAPESDTLTEEMRKLAWEVDRVVWVAGDENPIRIVLIEEGDDEDGD